MKKFKKPLLISVPQDDDHGVKSPSRVGQKQNKQKSLLLFNENTISSSVYNEDDLHQQDDKPMTVCEQFVEYHTKGAYDKKKGLATEVQQSSNNRLQRNKKFNIIEFQQFMVEGDPKCKPNEIEVFDIKQKRQLRNNHKRQFSIEIPEQKQQRHQQMSIKFAFDLKNNESQNKMRKESVMKQPPAPSNKTSQKKGINPRFVFPTNDQQQQQLMYHKKQESFKRDEKQFQQKITNKKQVVEKDNQLILKQVNMQWRQKLDLMSKSFEKERQQFYKEKSRLEKEMMIKDGQIEMLQKLITGKYVGVKQLQKQKITNNNYGRNLIDSKKQSHLIGSHSSIRQNPNSGGILYVSDEKITAMQTILLQKDLQINTLLQRINQLNAVIEQLNTQLQDVRASLSKSQKMNQSLRNEMFIHEKKDQSEKLTRQFYKVRQSLIQVQKATKTPKGGVVKTKWQQDESSLQKQRQMERGDYPFRGIDDLHKRLESLKMNRIELESRGRIKSEMNYSLTSKNKTKGTFDFKGKFYDRQREFNLRDGRGY